MSTHDSQTSTSAGVKALFDVDPKDSTTILVSAPNTAVYNIDVTLDSSTGERVPITSGQNGNVVFNLEERVAQVGIDITTYVSGNVIFEVLSEIG